jgi:hypothetical protein
VIEEQDRLIAKKSGNPALTVKSVRRSGARYKPEVGPRESSLIAKDTKKNERRQEH